MTEQGGPGPVTRGLLIRWSTWFGLLNAVLFALVGVRYLLIFGWPGDPLAVLYIALVYPTQFAILAWLPLVLLGCLIALVWPRKGLLLPTGVLAASLGLSLMMLDTNVFEQNRFHLSALSAVLFDASTWVLTGVVFLALLGFEAMLAGSVWNFVRARRSRYGGWLALVLVLAWGGGQGMHIWADATGYTPVNAFTRFLPLYFPIKSKRLFAGLGWVDPVEAEKQRLLRRANAPDSGQLKYPLHELQCQATNVPNIAVIVIDALRPDRINAAATPAIAQFAAQSQQFTNHYSGGNSSRMGFFSMFYGLPSTYWQAFYDLQRAPVLMDKMQSLDYEIRAFSAVGFGSPAQIDRTVFAAIPATRLQVPGEHSHGNENAAVTALWQQWLTSRQQPDKPWFGLLYYDPGAFAIGQRNTFPAEWSEARKLDAGYMKRLGAMDAEVVKALAAVDAADGGRETLVILASDHGYEFDELGLGYLGHASNYGEYQLRATLLMRWPGREPHIYTHRSAHQDVPATLLKHVFGCSNPASDYSSGHNLFDGTSWDWLIAGSYTSHAIIEPGQVVVSYPGGFVELLGPDYKPGSKLALHPKVMQDAMLEMRRFYK